MYVAGVSHAHMIATYVRGGRIQMKVEQAQAEGVVTSFGVCRNDSSDVGRDDTTTRSAAVCHSEKVHLERMVDDKHSAKVSELVVGQDKYLDSFPWEKLQI